MVEFAYFCLGVIILVMFISAIILDSKIKYDNTKELKKNMNKYKTRTGGLHNDRIYERKRKSQ